MSICFFTITRLETGQMPRIITQAFTGFLQHQKIFCWPTCITFICITQQSTHNLHWVCGVNQFRSMNGLRKPCTKMSFSYFLSKCNSNSECSLEELFYKTIHNQMSRLITNYYYFLVLKMSLTSRHQQRCRGVALEAYRFLRRSKNLFFLHS